MPSTRLELVAALVDERGYVSVAELSKLFKVSEMTIRRDLAQLDRENRLRRTFGGAASLGSANSSPATSGGPAGLLIDRLDALVATALNPKYDGLLLETIRTKKAIPIIAESLSVEDEVTVVAVDSYQAGHDLGRWAGVYACRQWDGTANLLDLTYYLENTQLRSRGFVSGLTDSLPGAQVLLSLDAQSRYETAYQLTRDALTVHPQINMIFAINDITAWGAVQACRDLQIAPGGLAVFTFGLEGERLKNALADGEYCQAGLAMFPEIVAPTCIEAAIQAFNHQSLPKNLITPHLVLDAGNLDEFYQRTPTGWQIRWENTRNRLAFPLDIFHPPHASAVKTPRRVGLIVPFSEHEWYQNLAKEMRQYAGRFGIEFEIIDVHQSLKDEVDIRRKEIARLAAGEVLAGDVVLIDSGPIGCLLAEALLGRPALTVITNSLQIFETLRADSQITLILTGGVHRSSSQALVGPMAENALAELRADKLFLSAAGVSLGFGLSHEHISEVTVKQAMLRSARQVILLADHSNFEQDSVVQIAPLSVVHRLITDDALPASLRLELTKLGIEIRLATT